MIRSIFTSRRGATTNLSSDKMDFRSVEASSTSSLPISVRKHINTVPMVMLPRNTTYNKVVPPTVSPSCASELLISGQTSEAELPKQIYSYTKSQTSDMDDNICLSMYSGHCDIPFHLSTAPARSNCQ